MRRSTTARSGDVSRAVVSADSASPASCASQPRSRSARQRRERSTSSSSTMSAAGFSLVVMAEQRQFEDSAGTLTGFRFEDETSAQALRESARQKRPESHTRAPGGFVVKNGSAIRFKVSGVIPQPASVMVNRVACGSHSAASRDGLFGKTGVERVLHHRGQGFAVAAAGGRVDGPLAPRRRRSRCDRAWLPGSRPAPCSGTPSASSGHGRLSHRAPRSVRSSAAECGCISRLPRGSAARPP